MSKMRVAMATRFPYIESDAFSGLYQVSKNLCDALARRTDIQLHVVSSSDHVRQVERRQFNNYEVTFFPNHSDLLYYGSFYFFSSRTMKAELLSFRPDIVHCQAVAETAVGALMTRRPMVATIHGIAAAEIATARSLKIKLAYRVQSMVEAWYIPRLSNIISCSPYVTEFVREHNSKAQLYDISNPMDPLFFQVPLSHDCQRPRTILLLGAISYRKGHDLMIAALDQLTQQFPDLHLTVIGKEVDPAFAAQVKQQIQDHGLSEHVSWLGAVSQERLLQEMQRHQIVCLPSREDTLPMAISQAMIIGNIPVASNAGGIPQMIQDGKNGYLFPAGDATALSQTLAKVINLPNTTLTQMRTANRIFADKTYDPNSVAAQTVSVYRTILGN